MTRFATHIHRTRLAAGLSQERLAALSGLSQKYISQIERGDVPPPPITAARALCDALDIGPPWPATAFLEHLAVKDAVAKGVTAEQAYGDLVAEVREAVQHSTT